MGGKRLTGFVGVYFSRLYWLHEDIGHTAFANLYGWETAKVFKFLRVFAAVLALQLVNE
jgi:hypothetical protein